MSNVINNSNSNSALVSTLLASDSLMNPSVYSTKEINPPHSVTYSPHQPSNGNTPTQSNTTNFQVNKYGIVAQMLLSYKKTATVATEDALTVTFPVNDMFQILEKVELLSSRNFEAIDNNCSSKLFCSSL